jgi:hypothetical protein
MGIRKPRKQPDGQEQCKAHVWRSGVNGYVCIQCGVTLQALRPALAQSATPPAPAAAVERRGKCKHDGAGDSLVGAQGFYSDQKYASRWCVWCWQDQLALTLQWAFGSDVLKAEEQGDTFYQQQQDGRQ